MGTVVGNEAAWGLDPLSEEQPTDDRKRLDHSPIAALIASSYSINISRKRILAEGARRKYSAIWLNAAPASGRMMMRSRKRRRYSR
jgi:hypothetical protein